MSQFHRSILLLIISVTTTAVSASTLTLTPSVVGRFDDAFNPLPFDTSLPGPIMDGAGIYQIDFGFTVDGLTSNERGFANTLFDIDLTSGLQDTGGWTPVAAPPSISSTPTFFVNTDAGPSNTDLHGVIASIAPSLSAADPRTQLGRNGSSQLGSVYVRWDGVSSATLAARNIQYSMADHEGLFSNLVQTARGSVIQFGTPNPLAPDPLLPPPVVVPPMPPSSPVPVSVIPPSPISPVPPPAIIAQPPSLPAYNTNAKLTLTPHVAARFDENLNPLPFDASAGGSILSGPGYYQVDFNYTIDGLSAGERGFANTLFDVNLTGGLQDQLGWNANTATVGGNGAGPSHASPTYFVNQDAGTSSSDLHRIIASIAPNLDPSDPRSNLGKDTPAALGSVMVHWDGSTYSALSTNDVSFGVVDAQGNFVVAPGTAAGSVIEFGAPTTGQSRFVPQPAYTPPSVVPDPPSVITAPVNPVPTVPEPPPIPPAPPITTPATPPLVTTDPPAGQDPGSAPQYPAPDESYGFPSPPNFGWWYIDRDGLAIDPSDPAGPPILQRAPLIYSMQVGSVLPEITGVDDGSSLYTNGGVFLTYSEDGLATFTDFDGAAAIHTMYLGSVGSLTNNAIVSAAFSRLDATDSSSPAPEPATFALVGLALIGGLGLLRRR